MTQAFCISGLHTMPRSAGVGRVCEPGSLEAWDTCHTLTHLYSEYGWAELADTWHRALCISGLHTPPRSAGVGRFCESGNLEAWDTCHMLTHAYSKDGWAELAETWHRPFASVHCILCHVQLELGAFVNPAVSRRGTPATRSRTYTVKMAGQNWLTHGTGLLYQWTAYYATFSWSWALL
jgi:hypothetical protein